MKKASETKPKI